MKRKQPTTTTTPATTPTATQDHAFERAARVLGCRGDHFLTLREHISELQGTLTLIDALSNGEKPIDADPKLIGRILMDQLNRASKDISEAVNDLTFSRVR